MILVTLSTLILGSSQIASSGIYDAKPEKLSELWKKAEKASESINRILHSLRAYETIQDPTFLRVQSHLLRELVMETQISYMESAKAKGMSIKFDSIDPETSIEVDRHLFQRVCLGNCIYNAVRFGDEGSNVVISASKKGNQVTITCANQGPEIPQNILEDLFTFDFVNKPDKPLGQKSGGFCISITKLVVESLDGSFKIESRNGETFAILTLPSSQAVR